MSAEIVVRNPASAIHAWPAIVDAMPAPQTAWEKEQRSLYLEVNVGGLRTACVTRAQLTHLMVEDCLATRGGLKREPKLVFASNGHAIALANTDPAFRRLMDAADLIHADGMPAVFASRFTATPIPERTATTDFIHDAAKAAEANGLSFYLLGGTEEANAQCAAILKKAYPALRIVGRRNGYFKRADEGRICEEISRAGADVVWVGLGVPFEYDFSVRNRHRIRAGWFVTCGGCFNFVTGGYSRAPAWMQAMGLEWLYRLAKEPKRLFWRYAVTNPVAIYRLAANTCALPLSQRLTSLMARNVHLRVVETRG